MTDVESEWVVKDGKVDVRVLKRDSVFLLGNHYNG